MSDPIDSSAKRRTATETLRDLAENASGETISCREIVASFGERSFGFLLIIFSLPNCVPAPPGLGSILGLPVFLIAAQMVAEKPLPWLPRRVLDRRIETATLRKIVNVAAPRLAWLEKLVQPRFPEFFSPLMERATGLFVMLLSAVVMLPFPLTNLVPAVATVVVALAVIERDLVSLVVGSVVGICGVFLASGIILALLKVLVAAVTGIVN